MAEYEYEVDLYGRYETDHSYATIETFLLMLTETRSKPFELVEYDAPSWTGRVGHYYSIYEGEFHARLDVKAETSQQALKKAKAKVRRYVKEIACSPPKLEFV